MDFEAAPRDFALEIPALRGRGPSPFPRRFDDLLEDARGMGRAHRGREFESAKGQPEIFAQAPRLEISPGDPFGFKHRIESNRSVALRGTNPDHYFGGGGIT